MPNPPKRLGSNPDKPAFRAWKAQESDAAARVGGKVTARSGAGDEKGDARVNKLVTLECKSTNNKSFSVTMAMMEKLELAACNRGELPMLHIIFVDNFGKKIKGCCVIPEYALDLVSK